MESVQALLLSVAYWRLAITARLGKGCAVFLKRFLNCF